MSVIQGNVVSSGSQGYEIPQSLRFNDNDSAYLSRTPSVAGNRRTWTFSCWLKRGNLTGTYQVLLGSGSEATTDVRISFNSENRIVFYDRGNSSNLYTNALYRDTSSWYHIVFAYDTTQAISTDRMRLYVNGEQVTSFSASSYPSQNYETRINNSVLTYLGRLGSPANYFDGYLAETHFIDGQALTPDNFGEFDETYGHWKPIAYTGTYGTNGFYLPFDAKYGFVEDMVGDYDGTNYGATLTYDADYGDNVAVFNGSSNHVNTSLAIPNVFGISLWCKVDSAPAGSNSRLLEFSTGNGRQILVASDYASVFGFYYDSGSSKGVSLSNIIDSNWHHVYIDSSGTIYIDNVEVTQSQSLSYGVSSATLNLGYYSSGNSQYFDGSLSNIKIYEKSLNSAEITSLYNKEEVTDGLVAHYPLNSNVEGFKDSSGNSNNFTATNLQTTDIVKDSPTNNFATLNPLAKTNAVTTFSEGNTQAQTSTTGGLAYANMEIPDGKYYFEIVPTAHNGAKTFCIGIGEYNPLEDYIFQLNNSVSYYHNGTKYVDASNSSYGTSYDIGDVIGVAVDTSNNTVEFFNNNIAQGQITKVVKNYIPIIGDGSGTYSATYVANFGQDSSFAGNKTPQGYTDANGIGDFYYEPPEGYLALCTANLPEPTVVPSEHFNVVTWSGDNINNRFIDTYLTPDLVWVKQRGPNLSNNVICDTLRGDNNTLCSNTTTYQASPSEYGAANIETNGFSLVNGTATVAGSYMFEVNLLNAQFVAWNWKAGGAAVTNTDGSITSQVSANVDAGFSIVKFTGDGTGSGTVGHGLSKAPEVVLLKSLDVSGSWYWMTNAIDGSSDFLTFTTSSKIDTSMSFGSSTFQSWVGYSSDVISYCFHSVEGYSKIGTYTGNGSPDGTFVYCGFRPRYVMIKCTSANNGYESWYICDSERDTLNPIGSPSISLWANRSYAEGLRGQGSADGEFFQIDFTANGFKNRGSAAYETNNGGATYLFYAIAESPFKYSTAK